MANAYIQGLIDDTEDVVQAFGVEVAGEPFPGSVIAAEPDVVVS